MVFSTDGEVAKTDAIKLAGNKIKLNKVICYFHLRYKRMLYSVDILSLLRVRDHHRKQ